MSLAWDGLLGDHAQVQSGRDHSVLSSVNSVRPFSVEARKAVLLEGRSLAADQVSPGPALRRIKEATNLGRCGAPPGVQRGHDRSVQTF